MAPIRSLQLLRTPRIARPQTFRPLITRPYSATSTSRGGQDQKDAQQDRGKMNTEPNEYAKSGTDAGVGEKEGQAAFGTNNADPQEAKKKAGEGNDVNPLDASPANPELSQTTSEEGSGPGKKKSDKTNTVA